jgi:hypothetical protein
MKNSNRKWQALIKKNGCKKLKSIAIIKIAISPKPFDDKQSAVFY